MIDQKQYDNYIRIYKYGKERKIIYRLLVSKISKAKLAAKNRQTANRMKNRINRRKQQLELREIKYEKKNENKK